MKSAISLLLVCALAFSAVSANNDTTTAAAETEATTAAELPVCEASKHMTSFTACETLEAACKTFETATSESTCDDKCEEAAKAILDAAKTTFSDAKITDCTCAESSCGGDDDSSSTGVVAASVMAGLIGLFL